MMILAQAFDQILTVAFPAAGAGLLSFGIWGLVNDVRRRKIGKIEDRLSLDESVADSKRRDDLVVLDSEAQQKTFFGRLFSGTNWQTVYDQADMPVPLNTLAGYALLAAALALAGGILAGPSILVVAALPVVPVVLPIMYVLRRRAKRRSEFMKQLPDVLQLLTQAMRAGHPLMMGIEMVGQQLPDPAGQAFYLAFREQNFGMTVEEALGRMADRTDLLDLRMLVTAVSIQRQVGGDLAEVLDNIAGVIRERLEIFGQVQALTAEGRMSGWVLLGVPWFMLFAMNWMSPELMEPLFNAPTLQKIGVFMVFWQFLGLLAVRWIVNIKV